MAKIKDPVFIIGCPRSGTTLLYTILQSSKELWTSAKESHFVWDKFLPDKRDPLFSVYLNEENFHEGDREYIEEKYHRYTYNSEKVAGFVRRLFFNNKMRWFMKPAYEVLSSLNSLGKGLCLKQYRVIDKTPPNTYRVSFLKKAFPDAKFIYIQRDGKTNISSLIEGWRSNTRFNFGFRNFYDYNKKLSIKGYDGKVWKFTNPPGWEEYMDKSLEEVCAFQWMSAHKYALESFEKMNPNDYLVVKYEELITNPPKYISEICNFIDVSYKGPVEKFAEDLPVVSTSTKPDPKKWLKNKELIENILPMIEDIQVELGYDTIESNKPPAKTSSATKSKGKATTAS